MKSLSLNLTVLSILIIISSSCRKDYEIIHSYSEKTITNNGDNNSSNNKKDLIGFYLLNEGNMGSNKASLDFYDLQSGEYHRNIYAENNTNIVKELGDVGNDLQIYGSKLYAVINVSNYIEVMDSHTVKHIGRIDIPNVRYITFNNGKAYASSYVAPIKFDQNARVGYVAEIDTSSLKVLRTVNVGYQPEELVVANNKLYVANSGGYMFPKYDNTISVIDLQSFKEIKRIPVAINLHRMRATKYNELLVTSRGNYSDIPSKLYIVDLHSESVIKTINMAVSEFDICGDSAYVYSVEYNNNTRKNRISYGIINIKTKEIVSHNFIKDGSQEDIKIPYGLKVNPINKDIYITDAMDYVTPGRLYCFNKFGRLKWKVQTGDIPGHFAFLYQKK